MKKLEGFQRKYLRGLAHGLKPIVLIGQKGLTDELVKSAEQAFQSHELIKVKFNDFKEKEQKEEISKTLERDGEILINGLKLTEEHVTSRREIVGSSGEKVEIFHSEKLDVVLEIVI